jgi:nucleoid DNA-binding protein
MTKADLVKAVSRGTGFTQRDTMGVVNMFLDEIGKVLAEGKNIEIRGFGRFKVKSRRSRIARNPRKPTNTFEVPARVVPIFQASNELKKLVSEKVKTVAPGAP